MRLIPGNTWFAVPAAEPERRELCRQLSGGVGRISSSHADLPRRQISLNSNSRVLRGCLRRASAFHDVPMLTWAGAVAAVSARLFWGDEFPPARRVMRALLLKLSSFLGARPAPARAAGSFLLEV